MQCQNHPGVEGVDRCAGCAEPFCSDCLVEIHGQKYCGSCKVMAIGDHGPPVPVEEATIPCPEAGEALKYAILGIFCFGIILGPIAISKARGAKKLIAADPRLSGIGKANAALIIGVLVTILWIVGFIARLAPNRGF